jgi:glycine hydroxymethyltransferase
MVDIAHYSGLVAGGAYPNPVPYADFVTSTTHKSLRGPRGGFIIAKPEFEKIINSYVFPGLQGGPLMHVIAGKAIAFGEALKPEFKVYQAQVIKNAQAMVNSLQSRGYKIISGRTESHVFLVDLRPQNLTGKAADILLGEAHITINKNSIPDDPESPFVTSGIRLGTPAITTRGFKEKEAVLVGEYIADVLDKPEDKTIIESVRKKVAVLTKEFPVYGN